MSTRVANVDGTSLGTPLEPEFRRRGMESIHVQSARHPPAALSGAMAFHPDDYVAQKVHRGVLADTVKHLQAALGGQTLLCVVAGSEGARELADALSPALSLPGNDPSTTPARRDKYEMVGALQRAGVRTIPTCKTRDLAEALRWIGAEGGSFPTVVKPLRSVGTDGVTLCADETQVPAAFEQQLGRPIEPGLVNHELVVQRHIRGNEYIVDMASRGGRHCITGFWLHGNLLAHNDACFAYDHAWLLPRQSELQDTPWAHAEKALDALGIRVGVAHFEIMVDGAHRGGCPPAQRHGTSPVHADLGTGKLEAMVDAFADHDAFDRRIGKPHTLTRQGVAHAAGLRGRRRAARPASVRRPGAAAVVQRRADLGAARRPHRQDHQLLHPGKIDRIHDDRGARASDMRTLQQWEAADFYRLVTTQ